MDTQSANSDDRSEAANRLASVRTNQRGCALREICAFQGASFGPSSWEKSVYIMAMLERGLLFLAILLFQQTLCQRRLSAQFSLGDNTDSGYRVGNLFTNRPNSLTYGQSFLSAMMKPDDNFKVSTSGDITTSHAIDRDEICGKLDCCERPICYMIAEAYFFTTRQQPLAFNVTFTLSDENDNPPKFDIPQESLVKLPGWIPDQYRALPFLQLSVPESVKVISKLSLPLATDPDSVDFGIGSYELQPLHVNNSSTSVNPFRLVHERPRYGSESLTLIAGRSLDREEQDEYWFLVTAIGNGAPMLTGSLLLQIQVDDINDHVPVFQQPPLKSGHVIELPENAPIGRVVYILNATDLDSGQNGRISYAINYGASSPRSSALANKWVLDPITGDLSVAGVIDYENKDDRKFVLNLMAKDGGNPPLTATTTFTILITDLNDNPPTIEIKSTGEQGNTEDRFDIDENDEESRLLKLISVSDPDSHPPESISCSLKEKRRDFTLQKYNSLLYGLYNNRAFDFEEDTDADGFLNVGLSCTDNGSPSLSSDLTAKISLRDKNDNWPQFGHQSFVFKVYEDIPIGSVLGRIVARDLDSGQRGKLTYWLGADDPDDLDLIEIDRETGTLTTKVALDREEKETLLFHVTAADGGSQDLQQEFDEIPRDAKTNTTSVTIHLLDVNDNAPQYLGEKEVHVRENNEEGFVIVDNLLFQDNDLGENGTVKLFLTDYGYDAVEYLMPSHSIGIFTLLNDKQLVLTESVDREQNSKFFVRIIAMDGGKIRLTTTTTLTVIVDDENDNYPQLTYPLNGTMLSGPSHNYEAVDEQESRTIPVDTPIGSLVTTLRSRDLDAGDNGRVSYHLRKAESHELWYPTQQSQIRHVGIETSLQKHKLVTDGSHYFKVDEIDGHLRTSWLYGSHKDPIEGNSTEKPPSPPPFGVHVLVIELKDGGNPSLATRVVLYVNISESVSSGFFGLSGFGFGEAGLGNTVILILIIVCSFALIVSLTAAIFWVRLRVYTNNSVPPQTNGIKYQTGCVSVYHDGISRDPHDRGLGYIDGNGTFKPIDGIRWNPPNVLDPLQYAVHSPSDAGAQDANGGLAFIGKTPNGYVEPEEVQMLPMIHGSEADGMIMRGYDQLLVGNRGQYELCFPEAIPPNFTHLQAGSTESDSGLDSGGYMVGHASSPSPEGAMDQILGPPSELSGPSTFKPSRTRPYIHTSTGGCHTIASDALRQSPSKQFSHGQACNSSNLNGIHRSLGYIPHDSVSYCSC